MSNAVSGRNSLTSLVLLVIPTLVLQTPQPAIGQGNSWLKPTSGNWEEQEWSLGMLPGTNQSIMITNAGWKAVAIAPSTESYPDALTVYSITLASPPDSDNVLLFNYPGQQVPLTTTYLTVSSNTTVTMYDGALNLNGGGGEGMSIGGQFNQDASSTVLGSQMDVGYIGPGAYNLMSGNVWLQNIWLGGNYGGKMVQTGGTNSSGIVHLAGGEYDLVDGDFNADAYFEGGLLRQQGGRINHGIGVYSGTYFLDGGMVLGGVQLPAASGVSTTGSGAMMIQSGGTNASGLQVGNDTGYGTFVMSNGVSLGASLPIGARGTVVQWGGAQIITGAVSTATDYVARDYFGAGSYTLSGGSVSANAMNIGGHYTQTSGTNFTSGDIQVYGVYADMQVNGGVLFCSDLAVVDAWVGGFTQSGGLLVVSDEVSVGAETLYGWRGYVMSGGQLVVSNLLLVPGSKFTWTGGAIAQSGVLTMSAADFYLGGGDLQLGALNLTSGSASQTNSTLHLPVATACRLGFGDSSSQPWSSSAVLTILNYSGSFAGSGSQQLYFGSNAAALTASQLARILFVNPAGLSAGTYPARILQTGEIVPNGLTPTGRIQPMLALLPQADGSMQLNIRGEESVTYEIDISSNLVNWVPWTNVATPSGAGAVIDINARTQPHRLYRALLLP